MKRLFSSTNPASLALVKSMLEGAGIEYDMRNETMPYQGAAFYPELWILHDDDFSKASEIRDAAISQPEMFSTEVWTCPVCGEKIEGQFAACWKCGTARLDIA